MKIDGTFGYWVAVFAIVGYAVVSMCIGFYFGILMRRDEVKSRDSLLETNRAYIETLEKGIRVRDEALRLRGQLPPDYRGLPN